MKVETYEQNEIKEECQDEKTALLELSQKLGLSGQQGLLAEPTKTTFPYRRMNKLEERVYGVLLINKTELKNYDEGIVPLRVLQVAAHASEFSTCAYLEVWTNTAIKDPILVGRKERYGNENFILARWGEMLESMNVLKERAKEMLGPSLRIKISEIISKAQEIQSHADMHIDDYLNGGNSKVDPQVFW
jgi:hypothetical protein